MLESAFFQDLAVQMVAAGGVAVLFSRLGWPKVLGYICAGILMNGYTWGGCLLKDVGSVKIIGQLGVVFLMFGMGLSFSAKDMKKIKSVALPAAIVDTLVMIWLGYTVGTKVFGWAKVPSVFLGVAICDSATTMLAKVFDELGWGRRMFTKYVRKIIPERHRIDLKSDGDEKDGREHRLERVDQRLQLAADVAGRRDQADQKGAERQ